MSLDMFLEILRTLEGFATEFAFVWFQRNMDPDVGGDVVAFDCRSATTTPLTRQVEVVGTFAADVSFADMFLLEAVSQAKVKPGRHGSGGVVVNSRRVLLRSCISHRSLATDTADSHRCC
jgi:hypothetical protein